MSSGTHAARGAIGWTARERLRWAAMLRSPATPWVAFALLAAGTGALLLYETRGITVWFDEWIWVLTRRGGSAASFLDTYNGHLSLIPVAIYKLLWATAGLRTYVPYRVLLIVCHLTCCTLLFVYARRRVGGLLALVASALLLLFGPGWENLLWPFQITWLISLAAGLGALLLLDRRDRVGDIAACVLTGVALASSGIGVPIALGVVAEVALARRTWRVWWIPGVPLALYVLWSIGYQHTGITRHAFVAAPGFIATHVSSTLAAVAGLGGDTGQDGAGTLMTFGPSLLVAAVALAGWRVWRLRALSPRAVALATMAASFWVITALTRAFLANPYSSRYLYVSALFLILLAVELGRGLRPALWVQLAVAVLAAGAVLSNVGALRNEARVLRLQSQVTKADLGALQIGRPVISPGYLAHQIPGFPYVLVLARPYFATARALGSPADSASEILAAPDVAREAVDRELIRIHQAQLAPAPPARASFASPPQVEQSAGGAVVAAGPCDSFRPSAFAPPGAASQLELALPAAGVVVRAGRAPALVGLRRFAAGFQPLGSVAPQAQAALRIAPDASARPWHLLVSAGGPVTVCALG